jgi:Zn-dependent protease with chaperone function
MATTIPLPAGAAATRLHRANLAVGVLGLATAAFTLERLLESWRVDPHAGTSHTISLLGQKLAYPAANAGAIAVVALAAFVAGLINPRIYITTATLARPDAAATTAVLGHERHHARRRDPLRLTAGRVLAQALFFLPPLQTLVERHQLMAELSADEQAAPFLSRQPWVVVLALVPPAVALLALRQRATMRARWLTASSREGSPARRSTA